MCRAVNWQLDREIERRKIAALKPFLGRAVRGTGAIAVCRVRPDFAIAWVAVAWVSLAAVPGFASADEVYSSCPEAGTVFQNAEASGALDGTTFRLSDGREVRLAGVIAANDMDGDRDASIRARAALDHAVAGKHVALHGRADDRNRYGMLIAQVAVAEGDTRWVQGNLVSKGMLRVAPEVSEVPCTKALLGFEWQAREEQKGVWAEPRFSVEQADHIEALTAAAGRFALVEGTVRRVGETSSRTYLDFGRRYTEDFSIIIPRAARAAFAAAGVDLKALQGKHVRVRGVIFSSGGPAIEIRNPASLEIFASNGT